MYNILKMFFPLNLPAIFEDTSLPYTQKEVLSRDPYLPGLLRGQSSPPASPTAGLCQWRSSPSWIRCSPQSAWSPRRHTLQCEVGSPQLIAFTIPCTVVTHHYLNTASPRAPVGPFLNACHKHRL